jgi:hypothetical protein
VLNRADDQGSVRTGNPDPGEPGAEVELTPIFHALSRRAADPLELFRRDPLAAPLPVSHEPAPAGNRMMLRAVPAVRRPGPAHRAPAPAALPSVPARVSGSSAVAPSAPPVALTPRPLYLTALRGERVERPAGRHRAPGSADAGRSPRHRLHAVPAHSGARHTE